MTLRRTTPLLLVALALAGASATAASAPPPTDRSIKLDLIERLQHGPQILILGDSRGRQAEPSDLHRLTGLTAFNAAVMGGSAPDAWVFIRYTADRFPTQQRRYIWFVSAGLVGNVVDPRTDADPRGRRYLQEVEPYLSRQPETVEWPKQPFTGYRPDGGLAGRASSPSPAHVLKVKAEATAMVAEIERHPPTTATLGPQPRKLFEHLLAYLNGRGEEPVIVFNPIYPTVYAALQRYRNPVIAGSLRYLRTLHSSYDFRVVNAEDIRVWGGTSANWKNASHIDRFNMKRLLAYVVRHSGNALR